MASYLIEVPHENSKAACEQAVRIFLQSGSHFITNADWGCFDGEHKAWIIIDVDEKREARNILPPAFRKSAKITKLAKFEFDKQEQQLKVHS